MDLIKTQGLPPVKNNKDDIKVEIIQDLILYHYQTEKRNSPVFKSLPVYNPGKKMKNDRST
jgi:hypothetical protein